MSERIRQIPLRLPWLPDRWSLGAAIIAALVLAPVVSVLWLAATPDDNIWPHLIATTLPRYTINTVVLALSTAALAGVTGAVCAWLVVMHDFAGRRWLEWALLLPLGVPAYVGAYALTDFLEYAGPVQTGLRDAMGWQDARDYLFPEVRSRWAAVLVLSAALYPYVYLLARAAFREQSASGYDVARALGRGGAALFLRVGLPLARPAIAAGTAIVMMETVADFGVVDAFGVQTLTTGIFTVWLESRNVGGAAQIASAILAIIVLLVLLEKSARRRARHFQTSRSSRRPERRSLRGWRSVAAMTLCAVPVAIGFVLPVAVMAGHSAGAEQWLSPGLLRALGNTLWVAGIAAVLCTLGGVFMAFGARQARSSGARSLLPVTGIGYAAPGAVLALGILIPAARLDNAFADAVLAVTGIEIGLILVGTSAAVILAYVVRFFMIAQGAADAALGRIPPSLGHAARSLGQSPGGVLRRVQMPLMRASVGSALLLVFVDCVKELPATLLLRPFNFDTLATRTFEQASLENIAGAAPPALLIVGVGLLATALLARANR